MKKLFFRLSISGLVLGLLGLLTIAGVYFYVKPNLPDIDDLKDVQLQVPLRVYSVDGKLIAEFGNKRRIPLKYNEIPQSMVLAILAAEDDRFYSHPGVDYQGILRAVIHLIRTGEKGQGGSTITMQVARNFYLSREKTYLRKVMEIFLALKIERELSKSEILELYLNKIYLGHRAYGVGSAAQIYYGKPLSELNLAQFAMIAGLPKAPSAYNPIADPERAVLRRNYVLRRMLELAYITPEQYEEAKFAAISASVHASPLELEAPYIAEMVRSEMLERYGEEAYGIGLKVTTTVDSRLQASANKALRDALLAYDRRHGYRGAEGHVELPAELTPEDAAGHLKSLPTVGPLIPALVISTEEQSATVVLKDARVVNLGWDALSWASRYLDDNRTGPDPQQASDILKPGDIIRLEPIEAEQYKLAVVPTVAGALVSLRPDDGAVQALVGGFDYYHTKFNRVIQADRQPGSNFKPFVYSAALENGFTLASIINDAPVVFADDELESAWRPENYSGRFFGPTRLREALVRSRNLVSIRLLRATGLRSAMEHVSHFGFDPARLNRDLSMALGSSALTPMEIVRGYAVLANSGFLIEPYFIQRIEGPDGEVIEFANPAIACLPCETTEEGSEDGVLDSDSSFAEPQAESITEETADTGEATDTTTEESIPSLNLAPRTVDVRNVYLVTSMMQDVIKRGTGRRALSLGRNDLAGKTGTTNEQRDAWFSGFNRDVVTTAWVGFDTPRPLGNRETGARAALPMWIDYMREALSGLPEHRLEQPPGLVTVRIDPETGLLARSNNADAIFEIFREENVPDQQPEMGNSTPDNGSGTPTQPSQSGGMTEQLF